MLRVGVRWFLGVSAAGVSLMACTSAQKEGPSATVRTLPTVTVVVATSPEVTVIETTVETTTASTSTTSTTVPPATLAAKPGAPATIYSTPLALQAPGLDTYPVVTGEFTDQDFARIVAGRYREYWTQLDRLKPDLDRLLVWETETRAAESFKQIKGAVDDGRHFRAGTVDDFVVTNVDRSSNLVVVTFCSRENGTEWDLGKNRADTTDDRLVDEGLGTLRAQWALVKRGDVWKVDGVQDLLEGPCAPVFGT